MSEKNKREKSRSFRAHLYMHLLLQLGKYGVILRNVPIKYVQMQRMHTINENEREAY